MIIAKVAVKLKHDRGLTPCGSGGGTSNGVRMLALSFDYRKPLTIESGRELLIACVDEFTKAVNQEVRIHPYLKNYPFEPKNIQIGIFLQNSDGSNVNSELHVITAYNGVLKYKIDDPNGPLLKTLLEETYEEAVQKINEQHNSHAIPCQSDQLPFSCPSCQSQQNKGQKQFVLTLGACFQKPGTSILIHSPPFPSTNSTGGEYRARSLAWKRGSLRYIG